MASSFLNVISRAVAPRQKTLQSVPGNRGGWYPIIREAATGNWQRNLTVNAETAIGFSTVFSCVSQIASDCSKLRIKLVERVGNIWQETSNPAYSPVLATPNHFQTRIQFWETYFISKLTRGNTYVLKQRDARGVVTKLYVLDPNRVRPLVSEGGEVFYELNSDNLSGFGEQITVPAREIIHDRMNPLFHPLVGISPIWACALAAGQGLEIQKNSAKFFANASRPGGLLIAPGKIEADNARVLKENWQDNFGGDNAGKVAVLGDGLKYESLSVDPVDAQMLEQLKWTSENVCSVFRIPAFMVGVGPLPTQQNIQAALTLYYSQCIQSLLEAAESCLDTGLGMGANIGVEFDTDGLLRMDTATQTKALTDAIGGSLMTVNEARRKMDLPPLEGGDSAYLQQQYFSLQALAERDADKPFSKPDAAPPGAQATGKALQDFATRLEILEHREEALHSKMIGRRGK